MLNMTNSAKSHHGGVKLRFTPPWWGEAALHPH